MGYFGMHENVFNVLWHGYLKSPMNAKSTEGTKTPYRRQQLANSVMKRAVGSLFQKDQLPKE